MAQQRAQHGVFLVGRDIKPPADPLRHVGQLQGQERAGCGKVVKIGVGAGQLDVREQLSDIGAAFIITERTDDG